MTVHPRAQRVILRCSVVGLGILSAACGTDAPAGPAAIGRFRFVNLIQDGSKQPVNAILGGAPFGSAMPFGASSPFWVTSMVNYAPVSAGDHSLVLKHSLDTSVVVGFYTVNVPATRNVTAYATGGGGFSIQVTFDENPPPEPGTIILRIVNVSVAAGPVDVFLTAQTADLAAASPSVTNVGYEDVTPYFTIAAGTYRVRAVRAGVAPTERTGLNVVANINQDTWTSGGRTIVIADNSAGGVTFATARTLIDQ